MFSPAKGPRCLSLLTECPAEQTYEPKFVILNVFSRLRCLEKRAKSAKQLENDNNSVICWNYSGSSRTAGSCLQIFLCSLHQLPGNVYDPWQRTAGENSPLGAKPRSVLLVSRAELLQRFLRAGWLHPLRYFPPQNSHPVLKLIYTRGGLFHRV